MPGGLVEVGETLHQAALREVREETGLILKSVLFNRNHEIIITDQRGAIERHFVLAMFVGRCEKGEAVAGDDAAEISWFTMEDLELLNLVDNTRTFARESLEIVKQIT